jgi:hypothetical protein
VGHKHKTPWPSNHIHRRYPRFHRTRRISLQHHHAILHLHHLNPTLSTLVATPFFWRRIRRHNFRFHAMIVILVLSGIIIFLGTQHYLDLYRENVGHNSGCATEFIFEILPPRTEMKILQCSWTLCACTLVCVRWPTGIRNKLRSSDIIKNILRRLGLRYVGVLLLLLETRSLSPMSPNNDGKAHHWLSALDRCISSLTKSRRKVGPATALSGISSSICYLTTLPS